jgi:retinol dehydrogenase-12
MKSSAAPSERAATPSAAELGGRLFIVTGATAGIGRVTAGLLVDRGARVVIAGRTLAGCEAVAAPLRQRAGRDRAESLVLDLADLASVRAAAATVLDRDWRVAGLINNAGLAGTHGLTRDGFELTFGVNHLGHFLFTRLLEARLRASAPARVVNVSSGAHRTIAAIDWAALRQAARSRTGVHEYAVSKLCNILFTRELARRWAGTGVTSYALHPGVIATDIWRRIPQPLRWIMTRFMVAPNEGAATTLYCATAPELASVSGRYYEEEREATPSRAAEDDALAARLWDESERMVGLA